MAGMTEPAPARDLFKGRHFDQDVIVLCVRWYLSFKLSSRDLVQMMSERGIVLAHTTINCCSGNNPVANRPCNP
jgi:transposase-like protein